MKQALPVVFASWARLAMFLAFRGRQAEHGLVGPILSRPVVTICEGRGFVAKCLKAYVELRSRPILISVVGNNEAFNAVC